MTAAGRLDALFQGFPGSFPVFHWHSDTFAIPAGAAWLALGPGCPHQAFRHGRVAGLQFHLEIGAADAGGWARTYPGELAASGKCRAQIVGEIRAAEGEMKRLAALLLDNFLAGTIG